VEELIKRRRHLSGFEALLERTFNDCAIRRHSPPEPLTRKAARRLLLEFLENIKEDLTCHGGGRVAIPGFGVFTLRVRKPRRVINPVTKEAMVLPESTTVGFRPAKKLRYSVERR
jgi:DNA-binding protein HU-beta